MNVETILLLGYILLLLSALMIIHIFEHYLQMKKHQKNTRAAQDYILQKYGLNQVVKRRFPKKIIYENYINLITDIELSTDMRYLAYKDFVASKLIQKSLKQLRSKRTYKRLKAITFLSSFQETYIINTFIQMLETEKNERVKTHILYSLKNHVDDITVKAIIHSLHGSKRFYQSHVINFLQVYLPISVKNISIYFDREELEIIEVFADLAKVIYHPNFEILLKKHLLEIEDFIYNNVNNEYSKALPHRVKRLYYAVLTALSVQYGYPLNSDFYLLNNDENVCKVAIRSLNYLQTPNIVSLILKYGEQSSFKDAYSYGLLEIIEHDKLLYDHLLEFIRNSSTNSSGQIIARVLSLHLEYFILKLHKKDEVTFKKVFTILLNQSYTTEIINFLNQNKNTSIEKDILKIIIPYATENENFLIDLNRFLNPSIYRLTGFKSVKYGNERKKHIANEKRKTKWLIANIVISIVTLPLLYILFHFQVFFTFQFSMILPSFIVFVNEAFIFYYLSVNLIYFFLAILSYFKNSQQQKLWSIKKKTFLYEKGMVPSVSIIAPAYNEELSIVENIHSLLNLDYPNYEVIVVNDGSKDRTLEKVIHHFDLIRKEEVTKSNIHTEPVIAVYKNSSIPNLKVIDKVNGGKADALNVGINFAQNEYVCGIDADSILEGDALLKLMSSMMDHDKITIALGGSIIPVNSSIVDHGHIEKYRIPTNRLAAVQNIEYLRAFNISRMGFSQIKSLLIISGAFGIFEKRILVESGGYLTVSSMNKDTVGEDMELVVRVTRKAIESKLNYRVDFIAKARCYTEVPESLKSFLKQRKRWQRGLIDILSYHREMIMNPKYKQVGLIAMPYFYVFEAIGPLFEVQAYLAIIIGFGFGLLNTGILLLLLFVTVIMGVFLSLFSLLISESDQENFSLKEVFRLLGYAILENVGWRQFNSLYRVFGFFASLKENQAWGQMNRVGFMSNQNSQKNT